MTTLFRLDASIRTEGSVTRAVADTIESTVSERVPALQVVRRDVGLTPIPSTAWPASVTARFVPDSEWTPDQRAARALAAQLTDEIIAADVLLFAAPMYNFGVAQGFKTWCDLLLTDPRLAPGAEVPMAGRPAFLVTARGGGYTAGTPRHGWDHATAWMQRVLEDVWSLDLDVIETELTLAEVNPAMEGLRDLARQQLAESHVLAAQLAQATTVKLSTTV